MRTSDLIKDSVYKETVVPTTIFDLDGLDIRGYNDATSKANLDSFIEALIARVMREDQERRG